MTDPFVCPGEDHAQGEEAQQGTGQHSKQGQCSLCKEWNKSGITFSVTLLRVRVIVLFRIIIIIIIIIIFLFVIFIIIIIIIIRHKSYKKNQL